MKDIHRKHFFTNLHLANRRHWEQAASYWEELRDRDALWRRCPDDPELAFAGTALTQIRTFADPLTDKQVCVLGSGDNYAAFALAGMGARVTSTDIAQAQLDVAARRARILNLDIRFLRADATRLAPLASARFDLVCSTNGFFVWIADLASVFEEVFRLLKPGGCYIFYDVHPFLRPWRDQVQPLEMEKPYWDTGPFKDEDQPPSYEFNWTLADLLNPLVGAGLRLRRIDESPAGSSNFWKGASYEPGEDRSLLDWRQHPRAGLPVWLTVVAQKPG